MDEKSCAVGKVWRKVVGQKFRVFMGFFIVTTNKFLVFSHFILDLVG